MDSIDFEESLNGIIPSFWRVNVNTFPKRVLSKNRNNWIDIIKKDARYYFKISSIFLWAYVYGIALGDNAF